MPRLPVVSGAEAVKAFQTASWRVDRQRGSHVVGSGCSSQGIWQVCQFPQHKELAPGTLRSLIRIAGLTVEEFVSLL